MKSIVIGTICDIACVLWCAVMLLLALGIPVLFFVLFALLFHWFVLCLIPFIWAAPSCIASWFEENFPMNWAFENSNCFHGYK